MDLTSITSKQRKQIRSKAQKMRSIVIIGINGLTDSVLKEISSALFAHQVLKIKNIEKNREKREEIISTICKTLLCIKIQHIGNIAILYKNKEF